MTYNSEKLLILEMRQFNVRLGGKTKEAQKLIMKLFLAQSKNERNN